MDLFQYEPLDPNGNHIRLLRFSDEVGSQPGYALDSFDLNDCPPYEALSYTWGPPLPTCNITLNGRPFEIRENLSDFLERMRIGITLLDKDESPLLHPKYLWIDQLCINQSSEKEKSHQVKRMAEIYKQAQRVIVWLGRDDQQSGTAMRLIADTWFVDEVPTEYSLGNYPGVRFWSALADKHSDYLQRLFKDRQSVENLLHRPYWDRLWVVQEFVLARDIVLACGPYAITLAAIRRLMPIVTLPRGFYPYPYTHLQHIIARPEPILNLFDARHDRVKGTVFLNPGFYFLALLRDFSMRKCEDPRDRVYGLLALCNEKVGIVVDYSKPADVIFREVFSKLGHFEGYKKKWFLQLAEDMGVKQKRPAPSGS